MELEPRISEARDIMIEFADETGISTTKNPPRRYLWIDAHAVCNFLSLYRRTGEEEHKCLALNLIDQVHSLLGKHREDDRRRGWISGLSDKEGQNHPTAGGLRIGKKLNERGPHDAFDERLEWDRDGQYFHYLTKWMHALCRASAVTGEPRYCRWAIELAKAAHAGFTTVPPRGGKKGLFWKMSIDLTRPQVRSTGLHDPLDGFITYNELGLCAKRYSDGFKFPGLEAEIADTAAMNEGQHWATNDPLGIGGVLFDACRAFQLTAEGYLKNSAILEALLRDSKKSLESFASHSHLSPPAEYRLAFRELGLSIGLHGIATMRDVVKGKPDLFGKSLQQDIEDLRKYVPLSEVIENFWRKPVNRRMSSWLDHRDINAVTLATSLLPDEYLIVRSEG